MTSKILDQLKKSKLIAECPNCQREFQLAKAILFDGSKPLPAKAEDKKNKMLEGLDELKQEIKDREDELKNSLINTPKRAERGAISSNLGTLMQNFLPYNKDFNKNMSMADSRFLSQQLDVIVFDGASNNDVKHITFMDAKTGDAKMEHNQKQISDVVANGRVRSELF
jgi:predicted Holliday junction resolvase-like endonuclease